MNAAVDDQSGRAPISEADLVEQFLTFELADGLYAIPILAVQEIRGWERVTQIPQASAHILGVINLRGTVVPVLDVRARLGLETRGVTATTVVIVVRVEVSAGRTRTVGCVVDAVSDVTTIVSDEISPPPDTCSSMQAQVVRGVATVEKQLALVLDVRRLIDPTVTAQVSERQGQETDFAAMSAGMSDGSGIVAAHA